MNKVDINVMTELLSNAIAEALMPQIRGNALGVVKHFATSKPKPNPKDKAEFHFKIDIEMRALYGILDKIYEMQGRKVNNITRQVKRPGPEDYR